MAKKSTQISGLFTHKPSNQTLSRGTGVAAANRAAQQDRLNSLITRKGPAKKP